MWMGKWEMVFFKQWLGEHSEDSVVVLCYLPSSMYTNHGFVGSLIINFVGSTPF
jgi:hypothetical protein